MGLSLSNVILMMDKRRPLFGVGTREMGFREPDALPLLCVCDVFLAIIAKMERCLRDTVERRSSLMVDMRSEHALCGLINSRICFDTLCFEVRQVCL